MINEKQVKKISLSNFLLILALIMIVIIGFFIYKFKFEKDIQTKKLNELNNLQSTNDIVSNTINNNSVLDTNYSESDDVKYEFISEKNEYGNDTIVLIKAIKDGTTINKEINTEDIIVDTGITTIPEINTVAYIAVTGGEAYNVIFYKLINDEIEKIGSIDCGADMVEEATYSVDKKDETTVIITANRNSEIIKKEVKMSAMISKIEIIDINKCGKVVLVGENNNGNEIFKVFRLSQDYISGNTTGIIEAGTINILSK